MVEMGEEFALCCLDGTSKLFEGMDGVASNGLPAINGLTGKIGGNGNSGVKPADIAKLAGEIKARSAKQWKNL